MRTTLTYGGGLDPRLMPLLFVLFTAALDVAWLVALTYLRKAYLRRRR
jgi:hypothetical protein